MTTIPSVTGLTYNDALATLGAAGYTIAGSRFEFSDSGASGTVIGTEPPEGFELGTDIPIIVVIVSEGPQPPTVPNVVGGSPQLAVAVLQQAGYQVIEVFVETGPEGLGIVIDQNPAGESLAFLPGPVTISVGVPFPIDKPPTDPSATPIVE